MICVVSEFSYSQCIVYSIVNNSTIKILSQYNGAICLCKEEIHPIRVDPLRVWTLVDRSRTGPMTIVFYP